MVNRLKYLGIIQAFIVVSCLVYSVPTFGQMDEIQETRLQTARQLMVQNIGFYLDGAVEVNVELGTVQWRESEKQVLQQLTRIARQVATLQQVPGLTKELGFSEEVVELIGRVSSLTFRDLRHWRMAEGLTEADQWYVMVQSALDEVKMQVSVELNSRLNQALFLALSRAGMEGDLEWNEEQLDWLEVDGESPLPSLPWDWSESSEAALSLEDATAPWGSVEPELPDWSLWMGRLMQLLENQDRRLTALESRTGFADGGLLPSVQSDPSFSSIRLPEFIDVLFYSGSYELTLNAQLQLNEVMELMGRYPQLRVVCTGHADMQGSRLLNLSLSKNRAGAVRNYLLESGVESERVLLNYFGEERSASAGAGDRRVEVRFFVN